MAHDAHDHPHHGHDHGHHHAGHHHHAPANLGRAFAIAGPWLSGPTDVYWLPGTWTPEVAWHRVLGLAMLLVLAAWMRSEDRRTRRTEARADVRAAALHSLAWRGPPSHRSVLFAPGLAPKREQHASAGRPPPRRGTGPRR